MDVYIFREVETHTKPVDEFVDLFCEKLELLCQHSFIAAQQASCKSGLGPRDTKILPGRVNYEHYTELQHSKGALGTIFRVQIRP